MTKQTSDFFLLCTLFVFGFLESVKTSQLYIDQHTHSSVDIFCRPLDTSTDGDEVAAIQIFKADGAAQTLIARIERDSNAVTIAEDFQDTFQGRGVINKGVMTGSFLHLTIYDAKPIHTGQYICNVSRTDKSGNLYHTASSGYLSIKDTNELSKLDAQLQKLTSKMAFYEEQGNEQKEAFRMLQAKFTKLESQMMANENAFKKKRNVQEDTIKSLLNDITDLNSKISSQTCSCGKETTNQTDSFKHVQTNRTNMESQIATKEKDLDEKVNKQENSYRRLVQRIDTMENDIQYQFETIRRKDYVSDGVLHAALHEAIKSVEARITQSGVQNSLTNSSSGIQFAKQGDLDDVKIEVTKFGDMLAAESEQISLLRDKVSVNEFLITSLSSIPRGPTKSHQKDPLVQVAERVTALEQDYQNQTQLLQDLSQKAVEQETNVSAFSARLKKVIVTAKNQVILFDDVRVNKGNAYDPTTGVFTAPRSGIYGFNLVIFSRKPDDWIDLALQSNNAVLMTLSSHETDHEEQTSVSTVAKLNAGDEVKAIVKYTSTNSKVKKTKIVNQSLSGFSGYFIQAV